MLRRLLLSAIALGGLAQAATPPRIDLAVTPAWKGWSRPGRSTELDIRLSADAATRATLDIVAGTQSVRTDLDLQPGRPLRLQVPVGAAARVAVSLVAPDMQPGRRDITIAQSESPVLGVGLATDARVELEGFHSVALGADDLPRNAAAYASVDALVLDAPTLAALDQRQLDALLAHAAGCGRIVVLDADAHVRRVLDGARACGGQTLMHAGSLADAKQRLEASLATSLPPPLSLASIGELGQTGHLVWHRVALGLAAYFAAAFLAVLFVSSLPALLLGPLLASAAALALLHAMPAPSQLLVWSEGEAGARLARYQAWQQSPGRVRERTRMAIPAQLASSAQACATTQALHFDFDAVRGRATSAEFESRLFRQVWLCYAGAFPIARSLASEVRADGGHEVRNVGTTTWPAGAFLAAGRVHDLPALDPGARSSFDARSGGPARDAARRMAMTRVRPDGVAALWELDLGGVTGAPAGSRGWLLVSAALP